MNTDVKEKIFAEQAKKGMIQFDMEKFIYDFTHLYKVILNSMDEYAKAYAPVPGKEESYWQRRCEAAELIIGISGTVDCEGYEQWERLRDAQPIASPSIAVDENKEEVNKLLIDSNELIRSFYSIAARYGKDTNWDAFLRKVEGVLNEQHKILYPHGNEIEKI